MAFIQTGIELQDHFSGVLYSIMDSVKIAISSMYDMQQAMSADVDVSSLDSARDAINQATAALHEMNNAMEASSAQPVASPQAAPVWQSDNMQIFTNTGIERFQQEVRSANAMLEQLCSTQDSIARQAYNTNIFPPEAFQNLNSLAVRIDNIRERIQQIENSPMDMGADMASEEMEQLRSQLSRLLDDQNELNRAMERMDVSDANEAYLRLSRTVGNTERYIRDNTVEQTRFNQQIRDGTSQANDLMGSIKGVVAAYISIQSVGAVLNVSDELTQASGRLNLITGETETLSELQDKIYASAERSRASYIDTASAVSQLANNAGGVFESNDEIIAFLEAVNKQFVIGGSSAESMKGAMTQLTQALAAGALRGDELNSVLEGAPGIARAIESSMGWAEGSIKSYAEEGLVTAEVVKNAMLSSTEEINEEFDSIPETWGQVWTSIQNDAMMAMQPVLQSINGLANSEGFQGLIDTAMQALDTLANSEALQSFIDKINEMINTLNSSGAFQGLINGVVTAFGILSNLASGFLDMVNQIFSSLNDSGAIQGLINGVVIALDVIGNVVSKAFELIGSLASFVIDNWSIIEPIIMGVVTALGLYYGAMLLYNTITGISTAITAAKTFAEKVHAASLAMATGATFAETVAQNGLNAALLACPLTWIILLIIALIAIIFAVCSAIAKMTGVANSGFGVICGGVNVVIQFFKNLGLMVANIALGIGNAIGALCSNMMTAFHNAICSVQSWFYNLLSTALSVIEGICSALNKLPFVEFDYSGITSAADDYAAKAEEAAGNKEDYQSISDAFNEGFGTFDAFQDGWVEDAFNSGAEWGDGVTDKVGEFMDGIGEIQQPKDYTYQPYDGGGGISGGTGGGISDGIDSSGGISGGTGGGISDGIDSSGTAGNVADIADSVSATQEDLKYIRDLAEQETVNRFTIAEINIDQSGMTNTINNGTNDLDGFVSGLTDAVNEAVDKITEGVHS